MKSHSLALLVCASTLGLVACSGASGPEGGAPVPSSTSTTPQPSAAAATASASAPASASASAAVAEPAPAQSASAVAAPEPAPSASVAAPKEEAPLPAVKVKNIGMHIGGGPNDDATKAPIHRSVEPHFDELRRCFAKVEDQKKGGDFGVDLLIDGQGGKAKVSHPRTSLKGDGFKDCVVAVYEGIDFLKPKGSKKTMVSYSIRFTP